MVVAKEKALTNLVSLSCSSYVRLMAHSCYMLVNSWLMDKKWCILSNSECFTGLWCTITWLQYTYSAQNYLNTTYYKNIWNRNWNQFSSINQRKFLYSNWHQQQFMESPINIMHKYRYLSNLGYDSLSYAPNCNILYRITKIYQVSSHPIFLVPV